MAAADCNINKYKGANQNDALKCPKNPVRIYELEDIRAGLRDSIDPMMSASMGLCNVSPVVNVAAGTIVLNIYAIHAITNVVVDTAISVIKVGQEPSLAALAGITILAGDTVYLPLTSTRLVSGVAQIMAHPFI